MWPHNHKAHRIIHMMKALNYKTFLRIHYRVRSQSQGLPLAT